MEQFEARRSKSLTQFEEDEWRRFSAGDLKTLLGFSSHRFIN